MNAEAPHHNNLTCYKEYGCRRPECVERHGAWARTRHRRRGYGTWQPFVDAEPVRQHILRLREYGISAKRTADLAGLYEAEVNGILYNISGRPPRQKIRPEIAEKILAVKPRPENIAEQRNVEATGTRRRLQALAALGFPFRRLGDHLPLHSSHVRRATVTQHVQLRTARLVAELYERLANEDPTDWGITPGSALKQKRYAAKQGWHPPIAWDDDTIDDPNATPWTGEEPQLNRNELAAIRRQEIEHLAGFGFAPEEIAARLGDDIAVSTVKGILADLRNGPRDRRKEVAA
ncbi:hypothetical protein [Streptomyces sp. NRRL F-5630]|uniref:hypothetical protein n=1 Tax=Streptomyces sp. NRRL F-5630 TaxID=1463864 RepID=UPI003EC06BCE